MITGFNTDIEYKGVTYHVQTEDKGVTTPLILSLVYDRGTILASKRSPYNDLLLLPSFDEKALSERLQKQHKLICAAVRAGRIEELKRMTTDTASRQKQVAAQKKIDSQVENKEVIPKPEDKVPQRIEAEYETKKVPPPHQQTAPKVSVPDMQTGKFALDLPETIVENKFKEDFSSDENLIPDLLIGIVEDEPVIEVIDILEDEEIVLSAEAVEIVADITSAAQIAPDTLDTLKIELLGDANFKSGERKTVNILAYKGTEKQCLNGAHIMIKVFGSAFRPLIFHAKTDQSGIASVHLQMPHFKVGRAAILIKAMNDGEETELRRVIKQG